MIGGTRVSYDGEDQGMIGGGRVCTKVHCYWSCYNSAKVLTSD